MKNFIKAAVIAVAIFLLGLPAFSAYAGPGGTYVEGWQTRFNVSDLDYSIYWYQENLGLEIGAYYGDYAELFYPESACPSTDIGLSEGEADGSNKATATIVVSDILKAQRALQTPSTPICDAGGGVGLTFFCDPDNNSLAFRQNGYDGPSVAPCPSPVCPLW
ncbi:MAG: VOC family protein [Oscillatoria sp. SIO1A7]|nr:VOC family protein [Oscillatoria sp. SIO1A7]